MKFHYYVSLLLLIFCAALGSTYFLGEGEGLILAMMLQTVVGGQQILSSLSAVIFRWPQQSYFRGHLLFSGVYLAMLVLIHEVFTEDIFLFFLFGLPWLVAIYHTYTIRDMISKSEVASS